METLPYPAFDNIFEADYNHALCPQLEQFSSVLDGSLDCLHVNIDVPVSAGPNNLLPVFVWIYGGRFEIGSADKFLYGAKYLIRHDIILVTLNYRLGPYGFMCLDIPEVPGNQGLKDQLDALKWIREHISAFGGDPDNITIGGNSAGSMSVDFHLLRKNDGQKYFHKVILESGTSFSPSFPEPMKDAPIRIAGVLDFVTNDIHEALNFLKTVDPLEVINASLSLDLVLRPCVEKSFDGVVPFLAEDWVSMEKMENVKDMSILIGFNDQESYIEYIERDFNYSVKDLLVITFDVDNEDFTDMDDIVRQFFYGDEESSMDMLLAGVNITSDMAFIYPTVRSAQRYINSEAKNVFLYEFSYVGARNFMQSMRGVRGTGAFHADEIGYIYDIVFLPEPTPEEQLVIDRVTTMWTNFIKYGNPTPETSELLPVIWEPMTSSSGFTYLSINSRLANSVDVLKRAAFWDLFFEANRHLEKFVIVNGEKSNKNT